MISVKSKMVNLVYYRNERQNFKTAFEKKMSINEVEIVFTKLVRHFKLGQVYLTWTSGRNHPRASRFPRKVLLNVDWNNFGILCHELAHIKQMVKGNAGHNWHSKKHLKYMKGMVNYCTKKNFWQEELNKLQIPKPIKPEPTKDELKASLILRLEKNCKRYQTKIKMYSNKLKKSQKKLIRLRKE